MIEVKNLIKVYGNHRAVDNISFTIEEGKIYGFLGPNGAGKSTTMNIMTGYIAATSGEVIINGHNILDEPEEAKSCIGYLPEMPPLYMEMTVEEYLKFAAELKQIKKKDRAAQVEEVIRLTKLQEYRKRLIGSLSKGYKQRVGLAQAVLGMPEIIILDEPTVGLDPKQIIEIRDLIKTLSKKHTVILSSHILQEISAVCDHILIIARGRLVASDTPEKLVQAYTEKKQMKLLVRGSIPEVKDVLGEISDIVSSSVTSSYIERNVSEVILEVNPQADIREKIFRAFASYDLPILQMVNYEPSLEDVFIELTSKAEEEAIIREEIEAERKHERKKHSVPEPEKLGETEKPEKSGEPENAGECGEADGEETYALDIKEKKEEE